jgi:hypothetical protein
MASQVLSGATNASYTNNTGQNVRLIINYMSNVTSMTWAGVNVTASATTIGKDIQNITGELRQGVAGTRLSTFTFTGGSTTVDSLEIDSAKATLLTLNVGNNPLRIPARPGQTATNFTSAASQGDGNSFYSGSSDLTNSASQNYSQDLPNIFYVPLTVSRGGNFPVELMLANNQSFSATCGAYNVIVIKEDGT